MKLCPTCRTKYPDDANFCPQEACATPDGPQRLQDVPEPRAGAAAPAPAAEPRGRFQIMARLGGSSTGVVSKARDSESRAEVAYKVVAPEVVPTAAALSRAEREFKQLMRVQSPKIAAIVDCGRTADDRLYVAMELCPGEPLDRLLKNGPMPFDKAKALIAQIGQALLEAQKAGIVHRDVSPKNVLITSTRDVKVINFPIARPVTDKIAGVPAYVSPEQAQGKPVDQRSNTYSLACILYHLLTGEPPFQASTPQGVLDLHISSPPLPPSQRRPEANLSPDIDRVILKALDKNSSRRHLTLRLFLTEIEGLSIPGAGGHATPASGAKGEGFAKTMLFAGGQAEVANLVAKAIAARTGGTPAAGSPVVRTATPSLGSPMTAQASAAPAMAAAVASTMAAQTIKEPVSSFPTVAAVPARSPTPIAQPVVSEAPAVVAATAAAPAAGKPTGNKDDPAAFRETLWFKKGDVDQMVAEAKAKLAAGNKPAEVELPVDDVRPLEDRYLDDGSVTTDDRKKFSLRTGGTSTAMPAAGRAAVPGESMSEKEVMEEIAGTRRTMILVIAGAVITAVVLVLLLMMRNKTPAPGAAPAHSNLTAPVDPAAAARTPAIADDPAHAPEPPPPTAAVAKSDSVAPAPTEPQVKKKPSRRAKSHHRH
jgi:hypothetical protein